MGKKMVDLTEKINSKQINFEMGWKLYNSDPHLFEEVQGLVFQTDASEFINFEGRFEKNITPMTSIGGFVNHDNSHNAVDVVITNVYVGHENTLTV